MTDKCLDIGTIQAFLDGELDSVKSESVARHVAACDDCAILLAESEEESAFAFSALEQEFNTLVPTQRLWAKINDSIERERKSFWKPIFAFLLKPQTAAFASLVFVAVVSITLLSLKPDESPNNIAQTKQIEKNPSVAVAKITASEPVKNIEPVAAPPTAPVRRDAQPANFEPTKNEIRPVNTSVVRSEKSADDVKPQTFTPQKVNPASGEMIRGEDSYLKTIASLTQTVNAGKDQTLSASSRFQFERDLAVTDDAIAKMKREVQKNPNNEAARQILRASYQNKIDLLNSVADKTELMASLK